MNPSSKSGYNLYLNGPLHNQLSLDYLCLANWVHLAILHLTNLSET